MDPAHRIAGVCERTATLQRTATRPPLRKSSFGVPGDQVMTIWRLTVLSAVTLATSTIAGYAGARVRPKSNACRRASTPGSRRWLALDHQLPRVPTPDSTDSRRRARSQLLKADLAKYRNRLSLSGKPWHVRAKQTRPAIWRLASKRSQRCYARSVPDVWMGMRSAFGRTSLLKGRRR